MTDLLQAPSMQALTQGPPVIALDTATATTCLAGIGKVFGEVREVFIEGAPQQASERLLLAIDDLLSSARLNFSDLHAVVWGHGPGSFTGLRVGLATIKGLCAGSDKPPRVLTASTLEMLAAQSRADRVAAVLHARTGDVFGAVYRIDGNDYHVLVPEGAYTIDDFRVRAQEVQAQLWVTHGVTAQTLGIEPNQTISANPRALYGIYAVRASLDSAGVNLPQLVPQYLRLSEPERKLLAQQAQAD